MENDEHEVRIMYENHLRRATLRILAKGPPVPEISATGRAADPTIWLIINLPVHVKGGRSCDGSAQSRPGWPVHLGVTDGALVASG